MTTALTLRFLSSLPAGFAPFPCCLSLPHDAAAASWSAVPPAYSSVFEEIAKTVNFNVVATGPAKPSSSGTLRRRNTLDEFSIPVSHPELACEERHSLARSSSQACELSQSWRKKKLQQRLKENAAKIPDTDFPLMNDGESETSISVWISAASVHLSISFMHSCARVVCVRVCR